MVNGWENVPAGICEMVVSQQLASLHELRQKLELEMQLCIVRIDLLETITHEQIKIKEEYRSGKRKDG